MDSAKRVALNTGFLYGKMLITMFISLYSTRLILKALGVEDYGIFNLVGGVIGMLSFLNVAMTVSTQRYLSYYLGAKQETLLKTVFTSSVALHLIIGLVVVVLLGIAGIFLFQGKLNIPADRIHEARIVYYLMIVSTFFTINAVPYDATINAHENMLYDAVVGIFEALLKLGIAFWLVYSRFDKLILYGILYASLVIIIRLTKSIYCLNKYEECHTDIRRFFNPSLFKEMFSFAGWNLFGAFCSVVTNQGLAVVLNLFGGVIVNAAYGVANQVNGQLSFFSSSIVKAINPQIVKSEGSGDRKRMLNLAMLACKLSFFLLSLFAIPLILEMKFVLHIWLDTVPEYAVVFCQLVLVTTLLRQLTQGLKIAIQSVGNIKAYQIVVGTLLIVALPIAVILLKMGFPPYSVFWAVIFLEIIAMGARVYFAKRITGLPVNQFVFRTALNSIAAVLLAIAIAYIPTRFMQEGFLRFLVTGGLSFGFTLLFAMILGMSKEENKKIGQLISSFINKLLKIRKTVHE